METSDVDNFGVKRQIVRFIIAITIYYCDMKLCWFIIRFGTLNIRRDEVGFLGFFGVQLSCYVRVLIDLQENNSTTHTSTKREEGEE